MFEEYEHEPLLYTALLKNFGPKDGEELLDPNRTPLEMVTKAELLMRNPDDVYRAVYILENTVIDRSILDSTDIEASLNRFILMFPYYDVCGQIRQLEQRFARIRAGKRTSLSPLEWKRRQEKVFASSADIQPTSHMEEIKDVSKVKRRKSDIAADVPSTCEDQDSRKRMKIDKVSSCSSSAPSSSKKRVEVRSSVRSSSLINTHSITSSSKESVEAKPAVGSTRLVNKNIPVDGHLEDTPSLRRIAHEPKQIIKKRNKNSSNVPRRPLPKVKAPVASIDLLDNIFNEMDRI